MSLDDNRESFSARLLAWHAQNGRHDLPWKQPCSAYRVWISEIMLQQTQVATVIPYFQRFIASFPDIQSLADADEDQVLQHWAGLGYYARARNLHRAAKLLATDNHAVFPDNYDAIISLPGIGRSTAGAILAQAFNQPFAILDGNVKRVLCRWRGIDGWPGTRALETTLWALATELTSSTQPAHYTQAIMDLGATLCRRSLAACAQCPVAEDCVSLAEGKVRERPERKPKKVLPQREIYILLQHNQHGYLLTKRPSLGIWGGLWSAPEFAERESLIEACRHLSNELPQALSPIAHRFTHYALTLYPYLLSTPQPRSLAESDSIWYNAQSAGKIATPAPIQRLLQQLL